LAHLRAQTPLPETADELCAVARDLKAGMEDVRLGARANEADLKTLSEQGALANYRVLHFATHGALSGEISGAAEPGLILSPPKAPTERDDGYLSAVEIAGLKLDADWVILSACNTAAGNAHNAEALFWPGAGAVLRRRTHAACFALGSRLACDRAAHKQSRFDNRRRSEHRPGRSAAALHAGPGGGRPGAPGSLGAVCGGRRGSGRTVARYCIPGLQARAVIVSLVLPPLMVPKSYHAAMASPWTWPPNDLDQESPYQVTTRALLQHAARAYTADRA